MLTVDHMREAWTYALSEIDAAISFLEDEGCSVVVSSGSSRAAGMWLINLRRNRVEYTVLLAEHLSVQ